MPNDFRAPKAIGLGTTTLLHDAYLDMAQQASTFPNRAPCGTWTY